MARPKGSKNRNTSALTQYADLSTDERLQLLANLIVDKIVDDQNNGKVIQKRIEATRAIGTLATS